MAFTPKIEINADKTAVNVLWDPTHTSRCNVKWLRFHCRCKRCVPEFSGMFPLDKDEFDDELYLTSAQEKDGVLHVQIDKEVMENHETAIPFEWLKENCNCDSCLKADIARSNFNFANPATTSVPRVCYDSLQSQEGKFECLKQIVDVGFCVIENVTRESLTVLKVGEMFGYIRSTLYEKFFDVKYEPDPYNSAYTSLGLPYHQDLPYYEAMPGVQLLHALEFDDSIKGGESQLVDLFHVADILKKESPENFEVLCTVPGTFQTKDLNRPNPAWYEHTRTHIEVDYFGNTVAIYWNPGVEGALRVRFEDEERYFKAYVHFLRILRRKELEFCFRMKPGDLIIFNNRRMAHARKEYNTKEGKRHLQGCYINLDDMKSTYMVLAHKLGKKVVPPKVGNRCWY
uniref:probable gamma-butyrobetaine dioxygenase n=1 Tax=Styela clava TaxID=7725 RepID=UPI001939BDA9|nr:probable gamma-butyrobetaine dioxygenase [Styela clava]